MIQIFVKKPNGGTLVFQVNRLNRVSELKQMIEERSGVAPELQSLQFGEKQYEDEVTIEDIYNKSSCFQDNEVPVLMPVRMLARLRGGVNIVHHQRHYHEDLRKGVAQLQASLVENASRRVRCTLDIQNEQEREEIRRKIIGQAQVTRAAYLFREAREQPPAVGSPMAAIHTGNFGIGQEQLAALTRDNDLADLERHGGVQGIAELLKSNIDKGINGDDAELLNSKNIFGSNTYPRKKGRNFLPFPWQAWQNLTLIILMVAAAASLALGIKTEGIKEGWYYGGSIALAVLLVKVATGNIPFQRGWQGFYGVMSVLLKYSSLGKVLMQ